MEGKLGDNGVPHLNLEENYYYVKVLFISPSHT